MDLATNLDESLQHTHVGTETSSRAGPKEVALGRFLPQILVVWWWMSLTWPQAALQATHGGLAGDHRWGQVALSSTKAAAEG